MYWELVEEGSLEERLAHKSDGLAGFNRNETCKFRRGLAGFEPKEASRRAALARPHLLVPTCWVCQQLAECSWLRMLARGVPASGVRRSLTTVHCSALPLLSTAQHTAGSAGLTHVHPALHALMCDLYTLPSPTAAAREERALQEALQLLKAVRL